MSIGIRLVRPTDAPAITAIYAHYVAETVISFEMVPPTVDEMARRMEKTLAQFPWLVATERDAVVGYAYAGKHSERAAYQWSADVSVYLHNEWHGRGIGRALYSTLFNMLRALGYINVYGGITLPNPASVGLHEAMGLTPVGVYHHVGYKYGAWHDVGWWQGPLQDLVADPAPPCALFALAPRDTWDAWLRSRDSSTLAHP
jgi:L-amino acid N-acyltransferase YncA